MKHLKKILEDGACGATGAGSVAAYPTPIGKKKNKLKMVTRVVPEQQEEKQEDIKPLILLSNVGDMPSAPVSPQGGALPINPVASTVVSAEEDMKMFAADVMDLIKNRIPRVIRSSPSPEQAYKREILNFQRKWRARIEGRYLEKFEPILEFMTPLGTNDVVSRLKSLEKRAEKTASTKDTATFGLKDSDGNSVMVTVPAEQAENFEHALQRVLTDEMMDGEEIESPEIAEILFTLKDHFKILDVQWPSVPEDEEELTNIGGADDPMAVDMGVEDPLAGMEDMPLEEPQDQTTDILQQVINMMVADAEARKAEAEAKKQEAKTKEVEALAKQAQALVRKEEEMLDMETQMKDQKERDKEIKRLAQLAQWKREIDKAQGGGEEPMFGMGSGFESPVQTKAPAAIMPGAEGEEKSVDDYNSGIKITPAVKQKLTPSGVASYILNRVKK